MSWFRSIIELHDRLLARDIARTRPWMIFLLLIAGILGIPLGMLSDHHLSKYLVAISGFATGVAVEKFAQIQVRRVEKKFGIKKF